MEKTKTTLKALFESRKDELAKKLTNLSLPKDAVLVQQIVTNYLNDLFDSEGDFRQNLTQSEDYILQAAMSLLNAQQSMVGEFIKNNTIWIADGKHQEERSNAEFKTLSEAAKLKSQEYPHVIGGSAVGGAAGALLLGSWGAVFGAIAGTALVLYYTSTQDAAKKTTAQSPATDTIIKKEDKESKIDVDKYLGFVGSICDSVDSLILTFRAQINRVVDKYENQEKPVFEKEYGVLLDCIQSLLGASYQPTDDKWLKRVNSRIEELAESLENYNLEVVMYDENNSQFFEVIETENATTPTVSLPAIIKKGSVIRKGKVFVNKLVF